MAIAPLFADRCAAALLGLLLFLEFIVLTAIFLILRNAVSFASLAFLGTLAHLFCDFCILSNRHCFGLIPFMISSTIDLYIVDPKITEWYITV